jgi:hypothetical protein
MRIGPPIQGLLHPVIGVRGGLLRLVLIVLALGAGWVVGDRRARGDDPRDRMAPEGRTTTASPGPGLMSARSSPSIAREIDRLDESADAGERRPDGDEEDESGPGPDYHPNVPGITRFHDLRGLGGSFYRIYGPRTVSRGLGLGTEAPVQVYGWIQNSFTGNPGRPADGINFGVNPNDLANRWMGNQYYLVIENKVEENDTVNLGFRVDSLSGNDWQFNHMHGLFDTSFRKNSFAGYDPAQLYGEIHLPILTPGGLDIRGGRWYSIVGFESVPAVTRPLLSVPYMFNYGQPFTHFGVLTTLHLSDRLKVYNGTVNGWDRWIDEHYRWGYIGGFIWSSRDGRNSVAFATVWGPNQFPIYLPANTEILPAGATAPPGRAGWPNPGYPYNDRTLVSAVYAHWWTGRLLEVVEGDYGYEQHVPGIGPGGTAENASWYGVGNWFLRAIVQDGDFHVLTGVWRAEVFRDNNGARTGYADTFYETTLGLIYRPRPWLWARPEVRFDWAQGRRPYDDGRSSSQFTIAFDVTVLF